MALYFRSFWFILSGLLFLACSKPITQTAALSPEPALQPGTRYMEERTRIVLQDSARAMSSEIILSPDELRLNNKLIALRKAMLADYEEANFFPPARNFYKSKKHIEATSLFKVIRKMPKGGVLHLHSGAAGEAKWMVKKVIEDPYGYVYWESSGADYVKGQMRFFKPGMEPEGFYKASHLNETVPNFEDSLGGLLVFNQKIAYDSVDIWEEFECRFQRLYGFVSYQPLYKKFFKASLQTLIDDGVQHVELRGILGSLYHPDYPNGYYTADSSIHYMKEVLAEIRQQVPDFSIKLVFTSLRFKSKAAIEQDLIEAFEMRRKYPDFVVGFDLVAREDDGHSTLYFLDQWLKLDSLEKAYQIDMPLYLHDGESDWKSVDNLYDAVLLNSRRIGHGFNLFKFPVLMDQVRKKDICLEINPLSNQILGYVTDLRVHPGSYYLSQGIPFSISSDDPMIFDYTGLSYDFWSIFLAWELDLRDLKKLVINSLQYSALSEEEKAVAFQFWEVKWNKFIKTALMEL